MKDIIDRIYKRTTEYSHPSQATTTANALDLLSSGIYTEEERFIFELLQNAVDSFDAQKQTALSIKIVITDNQLVFMHNGTPFSERDLEGLCDIGNGNKMTDAKKIGYKGIGFKSVFMHSHRVTVLTDDTCFKFDKEACDRLVKSKGVEYERVKLPWQIIPISTEIPSSIDTSGFNVITYIETANRKSLKSKVEKLLNDTRFLLFLKVDELRISFFDGANEILNLSKNQSNGVLTLSKNGEPQNSWLIYSKEVKLTSDIKEELIHDTKTPTKLKDSQSVEISFAIALDGDKNILPLNDAVMYTYLPTSFSFGLNFIVNANFITDAGRQQIIKDCAWNEFLFAQIPTLYLNWIADTISSEHNDWHKVLPRLSNKENELSIAYDNSLKEAINTIPFVRTNNRDSVLVKNVLQDSYQLYNAISQNVYDKFIADEVSSSASYNTLVSDEVGNALYLYGIASVTDNHVRKFIELTEKYLTNFTDEEILLFLNWLKSASEENIISKRELSYFKIIPNEDNVLTEPTNLFFPSEYTKENPDISEDAQIISSSLASLFNDDITCWLKELDVQEMSNISLVRKVLCKDGYIDEENAVDVMRFIFKCNNKENIFEQISKYDLQNLKLKTNGGQLKYASELYLADCYNPVCKIEELYPMDIFVSKDYPEDNSEIADWTLFLKKLGCKDDIKLESVKYGEGSWVMNHHTMSYYVNYAKRTEYNSWNGYRYYLGCGGDVYVYVMSSPLLTIPTTESMYDFYKIFWGKILSSFNFPNKNDDYIHGSTGMGWSKSAYLSNTMYLRKSFIEWIMSTNDIIPATDGHLHSIDNVLQNTKSNLDTFGEYYPVIKINGAICEEWSEKLPFKKDLSLSEYLEILNKISNDSIKEKIVANKEKINRIYERIADTWKDFSEGTSEYTIVHNWGEGHKILSKEGTFESPSSLYYLSSRLSGVDIDNQVFHANYLKNERFESFMTAMGVNIITNHRVEGLDNATLDDDIKRSLKRKIDFLTVVAAGNTFTQESWSEAKTKMNVAIDELEFYRAEFINVYYGNKPFSKTAYSTGKKFYFVGKFGLTNQELLHETMIKAIGFPAKSRTIFLTILQMENLEELKKYLKQKGYDVQFVQIPKDVVPVENTTKAIMGGEMSPNGGLDNEAKRIALEEAKDIILQKLENDGYDTSHKQLIDWTCIDGITKDGIEYPLVIRSNKSHRNTCITPSDWNQLMKPNAMFAVVTNGGVGTICFRDILKTKENITIRFSSSNIDLDKHLTELSKVFTYFKGIQIDFESYIPSTINRWERFMAPEQHTGELPKAVSPLALPE